MIYSEGAENVDCLQFKCWLINLKDLEHKLMLILATANSFCILRCCWLFLLPFLSISVAILYPIFFLPVLFQSFKINIYLYNFFSFSIGMRRSGTRLDTASECLPYHKVPTVPYIQSMGDDLNEISTIFLALF